MIAWLYLIWIIIFLYLKEISLATLCYVYCHYRYHHTCHVILLKAPSQELGHWSAIIWQTARVFIALTPGVPFKIPVPPMPPMIRPAIIEYARGISCEG